MEATAATAEAQAPAPTTPVVQSSLDTRNTTQPERAASIKEAWAQVTAELGEPLPPGEAEAKPEESETEAEAEPEEKPAKAERGKDGKFAKAKKAEEKPAEEPESVAAEPEEDEEPQERVGVRDLVHERRKLREKFERRERQLEQTHQQQAQQLQQQWQRLAPLAEVAKAIEHGDFDAIASGLGKWLGNEDVKDWNTLNSEALKAIQSPVYKKMRDLERRQEQERRERDEQAQNARQQYESQRAQAQRREWIDNITDELSGDDDPAVSALIDARPEVSQMVFSIQKSHYDETDGEVITPRKALERVVANVKQDLEFWTTFLEEHAEASRFVRKITGAKAPAAKGNQEAPIPAANGDRKTATSERQGAKAPKNVSHTRAASASVVAPMSEKDLKAFYARKMESDFAALK